MDSMQDYARRLLALLGKQPSPQDTVAAPPDLQRAAQSLLRQQRAHGVTQATLERAAAPAMVTGNPLWDRAWERAGELIARAKAAGITLEPDTSYQKCQTPGCSYNAAWTLITGKFHELGSTTRYVCNQHYEAEVERLAKGTVR